MIVNRTLTALLILNLFATLLVFRGMLVLSERINRPCAETPAAPSESRVRFGERPEGGAVESPSASAEMRLPRTPAEGPVESHERDAKFVDDEIESAIDDLGGIRSLFESEYADAEWTSRVLNVLHEIGMASEGFSGISQDLVDCRERICKLELRYPDTLIFDEYVGQLTVALKDEPSLSLYFDQPLALAGNSIVTLFIVRE